jgi:hypothetical protein
MLLQCGWCWSKMQAWCYSIGKWNHDRVFSMCWYCWHAKRLFRSISTRTRGCYISQISIRDKTWITCIVCVLQRAGSSRIPPLHDLSGISVAHTKQHHAVRIFLTWVQICPTIFLMLLGHIHLPNEMWSNRWTPEYPWSLQQNLHVNFPDFIHYFGLNFI